MAKRFCGKGMRQSRDLKRNALQEFFRIIIAVMTKLISNADARRIFLAKQDWARPNRVLRRPVAADPRSRLRADRQHPVGGAAITRSSSHATDLQTRAPDGATQIGALFEHWTHDASILPRQLLPLLEAQVPAGGGSLGGSLAQMARRASRTPSTEPERVSRDGAIMARDQADGHVSGGWWNWHPNKTALEYFWRTGKFAISGRSNFREGL